MGLDKILFEYDDFSEDVSKDVYVRNYHYHITKGKRKFTNITKEGKLDFLQQWIRILEIKLLEEKGEDLENIGYMMLLDDLEEIKVENEEGSKLEKIQSYIYSLNVVNSILEEVYNGE